MSDRKWHVAVVGAAGMVGGEMMRTVEQRGFPVADLRPLDVAELEGTEVTFAGRTLRCRTATAESFEGVEIALFSAGADASLALAPLAVSKGAVVIDNSSAWRMHPDCPLVVPEVNPRDLGWHKGIIANPNCSTIQMVVVLKPLHDRARITRVVVSTYQSVSGAGKAGTLELRQQTGEFLGTGRIAPPQTFAHQIAFNVIPHIDVFEEGGYTKEEWKMVRETTKIMGDDSIKVTATTVRVPVFVGHAESVNVETARELTAADARALLALAPGVVVVDDPTSRRYPMPAMAASTDEVFVGRIRQDHTVAHGLNLWIVADNVRKGAALNAVQIAERLVADGLVRVP